MVSSYMPIIWVVVSNIFYFHPEPWGNDPNLTNLICFKWVETTNQLWWDTRIIIDNHIWHHFFWRFTSWILAIDGLVWKKNKRIQEVRDNKKSMIIDRIIWIKNNSKKNVKCYPLTGTNITSKKSHQKREKRKIITDSKSLVFWERKVIAPIRIQNLNLNLPGETIYW